jgi:hypothetical protein
MHPKSILVASLVLSTLAASVMVAEAQGPKPGILRAPSTVGGTFTVNGSGDLNSANGLLSLREAILLANGGTGGDGTNTGLGRALTDGEKAQLSGCTTIGTTDNWTITGGCGAAITDTIVFDLSVGVTITLGTTSIPVINDTAPTIIDGTGISPTIDASGVTGSHNGLHISSSNNVIDRIGIAYASLSDFYVAGDNTTLSNIWAWNAGTNGIYLATANNSFIDSAVIGVHEPDVANCTGNGNAADGVFVNGGASNTVTNSVINCNSGNGITIDNGASGTIMPDNFIGTERGGVPLNLGNGGNGILIQNGSHNNTVGSLSNSYADHFQIYYNALDGVVISGTNTTTNTVFAGDIYYNGVNGIRIANGAHNNIIGNTSGFETAVGYNSQNGALVSGGAHDNIILGATYIFLNTRNGIELAGSGTTGNVISGTLNLSSVFSNTLDGINERNSADHNQWTRLSVFGNGGLGIDKNAGTDDANNITPPFPVITSIIVNGSTITVTGTATPSTGGTIVELYSGGLDPSGYGEGKDLRVYSIPVDSGGNWSAYVSASQGSCLTAFQTQNLGGGVYVSSEFGPTNCRLFLPLIMK